MKVRCFQKTFSAIATAAMLLISAGAALLPVNASEATTLCISQAKITEGVYSAAVDVTIADNTDGFLATAFGIVYDTDLTLEDVELVNDAGKAHTYANNPETGLIWFSGAAGDPSSVANTDEEVMFTLHFTVPEDVAMGDSFPIGFTWTGAENTQAYWHAADRSNIIGNIQCWTKNGSISFPDPNAPALNQETLQVATGCTQTLTLLNYEGTATWFSDNTNIATVDNGVVTGISVGSCTVYAYVNNTLLSCRIDVTEDAYYDISETDVIYLTDPEKAVYLRCPSEIQSVSWLSDNVNVVSVDADGRLHGGLNGAATVYAACGIQVYTVQVIVNFPTESSYDCGDVNKDGNISVIDVIMINQSIMHVATLDAEQEQLADCYADNTVDLQDSLVLLKHLINLVDLPVTPAQ